jgi:hypothetical protein
VTLKLNVAGGTPREVASTVNQLLDGKINAVSSVTLTANVSSTTVSDPRIGSTTLVFLTPETANAAAELATLYIAPADYVSGTSFKIHHANNAQTDRTFGYALLG